VTAVAQQGVTTTTTMLIKLFCSFLDTSFTMLIHVGDSENLIVYNLIIVVYRQHKLTFKEAKVNLCKLKFFVLVHPTSIETHFSK